MINKYPGVRTGPGPITEAQLVELELQRTAMERAIWAVMGPDPDSPDIGPPDHGRLLPFKRRRTKIYKFRKPTRPGK